MKFKVPVTYEMQGQITVEADTPELALDKAREVWSKRGRDCIELPSVEVDFAFGESLEEIESEVDEDE